MSSDAFDDEARARKQRAIARGVRMTASVVGVGEHSADPDDGSPESRIELLVELTRAAWAMTGKPWPAVPRADWPIRIRKLGEPG